MEGLMRCPCMHSSRYPGRGRLAACAGSSFTYCSSDADTTMLGPTGGGGMGAP